MLEYGEFVLSPKTAKAPMSKVARRSERSFSNMRIPYMAIPRDISSVHFFSPFHSKLGRQREYRVGKRQREYESSKPLFGPDIALQSVNFTKFHIPIFDNPKPLTHSCSYHWNQRSLLYLMSAKVGESILRPKVVKPPMSKSCRSKDIFTCRPDDIYAR